MDYSPWGKKIESVQKISCRFDKIFMCTKFGGCYLSDFRDIAPFLIFLQIFLLDHGLGSKNRIGSKKSMQVEVDMKCMQTNFGGHGLFGFGDVAPIHFSFQISLLVHGVKNRISSRNSYKSSLTRCICAPSFVVHCSSMFL